MAVELYGLSPKGLEQATQPTIELMLAFNPRLFAAKGWLGRYQHLRNAIDLIWNVPRRLNAKARNLDYDERKHDAFIWNEWTEQMMEEFVRDIQKGLDGEPLWATIVGSGNASWKTTSAAVYNLCAWFASPTDTICVLTSTSLPGLRKRIWKEILKYYRWANPGFGHVNASDFAIRFQKGSDEAGIFGVATGQDEGEIQKAVDKIIGFHAKNVIATVDEMQATNEAIVKGCSSLEAGAERFQFVGLGNPDNEMDSLGQMWEPVSGYDSITPETGQWQTKRGIGIHLNGLECPRVKEGDEYYPGMLRQLDIDSTRKAYGEDSPEFWRTRIGFIAPQGISKTVLSPTLIKKFHARETAIWVEGYKKAAALDPAFEGGDRCVLRPLRWGLIVRPGLPDIMAISYGKPIVIKVSATSQEPIHYQIVRQVKDYCEREAIPPDLFAMDSTGEGGGLASIFQREWSPAITLVEFGGRPSDRPVSEHNPKPENQEYINQVTALWYGFRTGVQNDHVRDLDNDTCIEFCQRLYYMRGNMKQVETKKEMKTRTKKSPDFADNAVVGWELFRQKENLSIGEVSTSGNQDDRWRKFVKQNDTFDQNAYLVDA